MTQPRMKVSTQVSTPEAYAPTERTDTTNEMLKEAGRALQVLPAENTRLREDKLNLSEKLSAAEAEVGFFGLAAQRCAQGLVAAAKIPETVERWKASGHDVDHWEGVTAGMMNPSFARAPDGEEGDSTFKRSSDLDSSGEDPHNEGHGHSHFDSGAVTEFLRDTAR